MPTETLRLEHFIGGRSVASGADGGTPSVNPATPSDVLAMVPNGTPEDAHAAVTAARAALDGWSRLPGPTRADHLYRWADAIAARADELTQATVREVGKPIAEARGEVGRCVAILRYYAGEAVREIGDVIPAQAPGALQFSLRQPLGVVALITPWNFPLAIPLWKAAPALALGNTVVLKPAEPAGYVASLLARTAADAGLPEGVFNVVYGGGTVGQALLEHPEVRGVSFTGSDRVGALVAQTCTRRNVKFQTEMGGKNVGIVLRDADLAQAANLVAGGAMRFAGQKCTATSRVVVERSVRGPFLNILGEAIAKLPIGPPDQEATAVGPVISEHSQRSLRSAIEGANAERVYGATTPSEGYFVPPTVFAGVDIDSPLAQDELFGPVLALVDAEDMEEAITLANRTRFGLSASLFTRDLRAALGYIHRIEAGLVRVNADTTGVDPHAPFGGVKGSSSGTREQGTAARDFYTETKTVQINP